MDFGKGKRITPMELIGTVYVAAAVAIVPTWTLFQLKKH